MSTSCVPGNLAGFGYDCVLLFFRLLSSIFFREVRPRGAYNIPRDGAVIFAAAPHANQFLDFLLASEVYRETRRKTEFLVAAKSMKMKVIGFLASLISSIPVERVQDHARPGSGLISLSTDDPCLIIGHGTKFSTELKPRYQLMLPKSLGSMTAEVLEIVSDTEMRIKHEFSGDSGKGTPRVQEEIKVVDETGVPGLQYKILPLINQQDMYRHVYQRLSAGRCIGIFPEGGSHDRTDLLPLKAGVAIMALGAMTNDPDLKVKVVPVGLSYFHAHRFRSRAVVEFGAALDVPTELVDMFKEGGTRKREACSKLMDRVYGGLKTVTLRAPDYETLMVIQAARRLYQTPGQHLTLGQVVKLNKLFLEAYNHFQDDPRVRRLKENVLKYNRSLRDLGLRDHQVPRAKPASFRALGLLGYRLLLLVVWSILALPGVVLNAPVFILASTISRKKAKDALVASTVKVAGRDVLATWKVLVALIVTPILYAIYALLAMYIAARTKLPMSWRTCTPAATLIVLPIMSYAALKFGEAGMDIVKSLGPLLIALSPGQQRSLDKIKKRRQELANELTSLINELGPKLWKDFNDMRVLVPSASVPPSSGTPGLWRRKSSTGGVDAQGSLLAHPMTWLDERLFGWSHSTTQGLRTCDGRSSERFSKSANPDLSEKGEGRGDHEHLLRSLTSNEGGDQKNLRSRSFRRLVSNP